MLEINGSFSSSKKTKHIKAKFFFIKDRISDGEIKVVDCPTKEMWADIKTKPAQGKLFNELQAKLMNCAVDYTDGDASTTVYAGRVSSKEPRTLAQQAHAAKPAQECVRKDAKSGYAHGAARARLLTRGTGVRARIVTRGRTWDNGRMAMRPAKE